MFLDFAESLHTYAEVTGLPPLELLSKNFGEAWAYSIAHSGALTHASASLPRHRLAVSLARKTSVTAAAYRQRKRPRNSLRRAWPE